MLLDAIATIILAGMMLIPIVNVFVGAVVGAALGGVPGAFGGVLLALAVTFAERLIADRLGWPEVPQHAEPRSAYGDEDDVVTTGGYRARRMRTESPRTRPPQQRVRAHRSRDVRDWTGPPGTIRERRSGAIR